MRARVVHSGVTVNAIAGTHVVMFGFDLTPAKRVGFRGFAVSRHDPVEQETFWLRGLKTFEKTEPHPAQGESFSTRHHPVQSFQWADFSTKPDREYTYRIEPRYGDPDHLETRYAQELTVRTEAEVGAKHSAFFNRGSVATQEYARRFENRKPSQAGPGAYEWLSRGLLEALLAFIAQADGPSWEIHAAVYEFQWRPVLDALRHAHHLGARVRVRFDNIEAHDKNGKPKGPWFRNREAIDAAHINHLCRGPQNGKLMHNKFFVLSKNGSPESVWTGSTNLTENGIFGHSNLGHIVRNPGVARDFRDYWDRLAADPEVDAAYRNANMQASPAPPIPWNANTVAVFSPRRTSLDSLEWYASLAAGAKDALFMTFAFGMHKKFKAIYRAADDVLRIALLEKEGNNPQTLEQDRKDIRELRKRPNVIVALGNRIRTNAFDRWLAEMSRLSDNVHVYWIHTKYMLVDPLGAEPIVVTGSANFSESSTETNDENMLVIRREPRVADIYLGEYMRLFNHYSFREAVKRFMDAQAAGTADEWQPNYLVDDDDWMDDYFDPADKSGRFARRKYFAGDMG